MSAALVVPDDAEPMPEQQVKQLKQAFSLFDKDGDQSITPKDLLKFMEGLGHKVTEIELEDMIRECNLASGKHGEEGGSSYIEFAAFYTTMAAALKLGDEAEHKGAFNIYDKEGKGHVTVAEMKKKMCASWFLPCIRTAPAR